MEQQPRLVISPLDRPHGNACLLQVAGDLEMSTAPQLRDTLTALPADTRLTLDLSGVTFCDSSGLNALLVVHRYFDAGNGHLVLSSAPRRVVTLLELTGLAEIFAVA